MLPIYALTEQQHSPVHPTFDLPARLAEFFLRWVRGTGHQGLCLASALVAFFRETGGPGQCRRLLPAKTIVRRSIGKQRKQAHWLSPPCLTGSLELWLTGTSCENGHYPAQH